MSMNDRVLKVRMREIQGAIAVSAIFQLLLGYAGLIGFLLRWIWDLKISNMIIMILNQMMSKKHQVDHPFDDHPSGFNDRSLPLWGGKLQRTGKLGSRHPVKKRHHKYQN